MQIIKQCLIKNELMSFGHHTYSKEEEINFRKINSCKGYIKKYIPP